jgi:plasmid stabilization system protein ParE
MDSPYYAVNFVERILAQADKLSQFPEIGRIVPEFQHHDLRELVFQNYRIVYRIKGKQIFIVAISQVMSYNR